MSRANNFRIPSVCFGAEALLLEGKRQRADRGKTKYLTTTQRFFLFVCLFSSWYQSKIK